MNTSDKISRIDKFKGTYKFRRAHKVLASLILSTLMVALVFALFSWFFRQVQDAEFARNKTRIAIENSNNLLGKLRDAELGQRGYSLTGNEVYLQPYQKVVDQIDGDFEKLQRLDLTISAKKHLFDLAPLIDKKLINMEQLIELRNKNEQASGVEMIVNGEGKFLMDAIRKEFERFNTIEENILQDDQILFEKATYRLFFIFLLSGFMALAGAIFFVFFIYLKSQQRLKNQDHLETLNLLKNQEALTRKLQSTNLRLLGNEEKLSVMVNSIGDAVIATDAEGRVSLMNPVAEKLTGWTQFEAMGMLINEIFIIISKKTRQYVNTPIMETLTKGTVQGMANHTILIARDGSECDIADSCAPIRNSDDEVIGAVLVFRDVSEEYAAQQALSDSAALIQTILNTVVDGIITLSASGGNIETVNPAAERMFGYSAAELIGKKFSVIIPELDRDQGHGSLEYYSASEADQSNGVVREVIGRRKDGSTVPIEISVGEMKLRELGQRYFTGILRDITLRKQAETQQKTVDQLLRDQQFYTRSLIESNIDALMTTNPIGVITDVNKQMELLTGCTREELIGSPFKNYFTDPYRAEEGIKQVLRENRVTNYELTARSRDGTETEVSYNAAIFFDRNKKLQGVFAAARDITERKVLDSLLYEKNTELLIAKSIAEKANLAKSDFLSSMSHELRTPLSAILGFAQLIYSAVPPPTATQKRSVEQILKAGWYLLALINEILDLALIESGKLSVSLEPVSLANVLEECEAMIEPQANSRQIAMHFPQVDSSYVVNADCTRLKQVLINLLSNAIKYNRIGGTLLVTCAESRPGTIRISVEDSGAGLSEKHIAQLFQPFNRLGQESNGEEGTGIGLVMTKRLIELMGGIIGVESTVGEGSVFWIEMDLSTQPVSSDEINKFEIHSPGVLSDTPLYTLLYVEDNPANLMLVEDIIARRPDIRLISARDGNSGIAMARRTHPDVILMDINLPGISGLKALKILSIDVSTAHIPVVALSANAIPRDIEKGLEAGFFRYLTKPINVNEFIQTLDVALEFAKSEALYVSR